jgi:hypothetical protein
MKLRQRKYFIIFAISDELEIAIQESRENQI